MRTRRSALAVMAVSVALILAGGLAFVAELTPVRAGDTAPLVDPRTTAPGDGHDEENPNASRGDGAPPDTVRPDTTRPPATDASTDPSPRTSWPEVTTRPARISEVDAGAGTSTAAPAQLRIGDLVIDAPVDPVGVEDDGGMEIPQDVDRLGWYRFGAAPGTGSGAVVLAGHVDSRRQGHGAFFDLAGVRPGADVELTDERGTVHRYRVTGVEQIPKDELPLDRVFRTTGPEVLALITCGGPFDRTARSYRDNVVVVAERVTGGA